MRVISNMRRIDHMAAPWAGVMNQICYAARSGLPVVSREKTFSKSHIINPLLTKLVRSRWLDIGLVRFLRIYGPRPHLGP